MSTKKKVAAGAAIGVAVPAAVGVAKKLLGNGDDSPEQSRQGQSARGRESSASRGQTRGRTSSKSKPSSGITRRSSSSTSGARERTKEELYSQAKRLNIEGRSKMSKTQLKRAVTRAKS